VPQTLKLWAELSGNKVSEFRPHGEGWIVNGTYYIYQVNGDIHEERKNVQS